MNYWGPTNGSNTWGLPAQEPAPQQEPVRIMQLYYCPTCGHWVDKAFRDTLEKAVLDFKDGMIRAFGGRTPEREPLPALTCPDGHGDLVLITATDRIAIRSAKEDQPHE